MNTTDKRQDLVDSATLIRFAGYGFLLFALSNTVTHFIPPDFLNPEWELGVMGPLVEQSPIPILGMLFAFYRGMDWRFEFEIPVLRFLSWASLVVAILYALMLPLLVADTLRIDSWYLRQAEQQDAQRLGGLSQLNQQLDGVESASTLRELAGRLRIQDGRLTPEADVDTYRKAIRGAILGEVQQIRQTNQAQVDERVGEQWVLTTKWLFEGSLAAIFFYLTWRFTRWARIDQWA